MHQTINHSYEENLELQSSRIAYFSLEFGFSQSMHQYAGGLGILAGDHLKSSSDLGLPMIGIGLLYHEGSPHQKIDPYGNQIDFFEHVHIDQLPLTQVSGESGHPLTIQVAFPEGDAIVRVYEAKIGRTTLLLLDTFHEENAHDIGLLQITDRLYHGDREHRLRQEILLGIGGIKVLNVMNVLPDIVHINEGHSAFALTELIAHEMRKQGKSFHEIINQIQSHLFFTTHTPISAGNEVFTNDLITQYLGIHCMDLDLSMDEFLELGKSPNTESHLFSMSAFALILAGASNAVSALHGEIAREMWKGIETKSKQITSITNGIHTQSWIGEHLAELLDQQIGNSWRQYPDSVESWSGVMDLSKDALFLAHDLQKKSMIATLEVRSAQTERSIELDPNGLYIGYARRFAMYKRAYLPFMHIESLQRILNHALGKVYLVIAGKAHPDDHEAKATIRHIHNLIQEHDLQSSVLLIEDYDIALAKSMVQGCDIWLNTPRRPLEASGTSGMKAALNGCLHCSISDGWWDEAYAPNIGFRIPHAEFPPSMEDQDKIESQAMYHVLEHEILPKYFSRYSNDEWSMLMKSSIFQLGPRFSSTRMVKDYAERFYIPGIMESKGGK
jgi:starch phosphorylase